jgi:hypothetical protein
MLATLSNRTPARFSNGLLDPGTLFRNNTWVLVGGLSAAQAQPFLAWRRRDPFCSSQTQLPSLSNNVHEFHTLFNEKILMVSIGGFRGKISDI